MVLPGKKDKYKRSVENPEIRLAKHDEVTRKQKGYQAT